jgi:hypothetical protein
MSSGTAIVEGTLNPDGSVQLDQMPNMTPGRVKVILQPASAITSPQRGLAEVIDEIRQGQQARGFQGRSAEEIDAARREGEDAYEQRMTALRPPSSGPNANP